MGAYQTTSVVVVYIININCPAIAGLWIDNSLVLAS